MAMLCVRGRCKSVYFDAADVVSVLEPVDVAAGKAPPGWCDWCAAIITLGRRGDPIELSITHDEWPAVKAALGLADAVNIKGN